ncbi:LysR family transcriptional regulator [Ruegeria atlantica]|uniref:LysR family transcriptional regulator n=1 Tax=Ruegeria atlantica TaxID=81569 RepID=UPI002495434C|nr:LysR family transcriptional regulator [Ruegeria atlantica]
MPEIEQLRAFVTAVECGSFSAAARKLGKAQSAVSATISNLEIDLDLSLFHRDGYRPVLTDAGESLLKHARSVLSSMDMLRGQAEALSGSIEPRFSFFVEDGLLVDRVRSLLTGTADKFPCLELRVEQLSRPSVLKAVQSGDADAAFVCEAPKEAQSYRCLGVGFQRVVPVCHADHPLAKLATVGRKDLSQYRQAVEPSSVASIAGDRIFSPDIWTSSTPITRKALVMGGLGWAELPVVSVEREILGGELKVLEYEFAQNAILRTVDFLTINATDQGPVMRWLTSEITTWDQRAWIGDHQVGRR